jgi:alanyl-tRNA synthetase
MSADGEEMIKCMTAKQIKKLARPEFAKNPDKFYPTTTLKKLGFERQNCPKCKNNYWRHTPDRKTCGDSNCEGAYSFIGRGTGIGRTGKKITYAEAYAGFERSLTSAKVPCTPIKRYPVVARWRADVDYVAAGIFCFQPYCVTGEMDPPANPLICPQFCLRFNDLDNIGLTGRHYSGFVMLGIQVFNKPDNRKFWMDECIEFNYRWLTDELGIDPDEITFIEDVWAGGGNLGPSVEYFVNGLELGNMVFMQFKTYPDGSREELDVQVIDVGIGLERVPWLINGSATSYMDVFPDAFNFMIEKVGVETKTDIWEKYGPLSCLLNVDEVEDLGATWQWIADQIGQDVDVVRKAIEPMRDVYIVLDHTRSVMMAITDGSLPSNVGGAANVRNILRRVFAILHRNQWWDSLGGMPGLLELFERHKTDLAKLYGDFAPYKSFNPIIELEYERWTTTDDKQKDQLRKLLKKRKNKLGLEDWITAVTAWGIPADTVATESKTEIPLNFWYTVAERQEQQMKALPAVLYNTSLLAETDNLYYKDHHLYEFKANVIKVFGNVQKNGEPSIVVLDQSAFYPTSGGQEHDTGKMTINGTEHDVVDVVKVGPCVLHILDPPLAIDTDDLDSLIGTSVSASIDQVRRDQLRNNHTATHIVYSSCRNVLGPHVWQHGAKKSIHQAHLDITHFQSLSHAEVRAIENEANRVVHRCKAIQKGFMAKDEAESKYGFHLYQGGVVPGNELRVVNIVDTDTEACCGTHCDNTAEVGTIKIIKTGRISDGIVRLYFVAGELALEELNEEADILHSLQADWNVPKQDLVKSATEFFNGYRSRGAQVEKQKQQILNLQMRLFMAGDSNLGVIRSDEANPTLYISSMPGYAQQLSEAKKGIVIVGDTFLYGLMGNAEMYDVKQFESEVLQLLETKSKDDDSKSDDAAATKGKKKKGKPVQFRHSNKVTAKIASGKGKAKKVVIKDVAEFRMFASASPDKILQILLDAEFEQLE